MLVKGLKIHPNHYQLALAESYLKLQFNDDDYHLNDQFDD